MMLDIHAASQGTSMPWQGEREAAPSRSGGERPAKERHYDDDERKSDLEV
jgi:hypothetical protein